MPNRDLHDQICDLQINLKMSRDCSKELRDENTSLQQQLTTALAERDEARRLLAAAEEGINRNCAEIAELKKSACPHGACDSLKGEIANLRAATRGPTFYHSDEEVNQEMGRLRSEVEGLKYYRDTLLRDMLDTAWQQGAEAMMKSVVKTVRGRISDPLAQELGALPVPERKETS